MIRVALFASGGGTNALNLLKVAESLTHLQIALVMVDQVRSPLPELVKAQYPQVEIALIPSPKLPDPKTNRKAHEEQIVSELRKNKIDWIFLAGYMRILGETLLSAYSANGNSRIVNIHPSLLPKYPGLHSYERAFDANDSEGGVTIHLVDAGMDTGPALAQKSFPRAKTDTLADFTDRGKALEWQMYGDLLRTLDAEQNLMPLSQRNSSK